MPNMYSHYSKINYSKGLSLVELMVAMLIVSVLLLGVTTVYRASKQAYRLNDEVAEIQENARFGYNNVTHEIRMAGYTGCARIRDMNINLNLNIMTRVQDIPDGFTNGLTGNTFIVGHSDATPNLVRNLTAPDGWERSNPAVTVINASACSASLTDNANPAARILVDPNNSCDFKTGDVVMISDCSNADIFTISNINIDKDNNIYEIFFTPPRNRPPARLSKTYDTSAQLHKLERYTYYIGTVGNEPIGLRQIRLTNINNRTVEDNRLLIPYANNMTIMYGIDSDNDGNVDGFYTTDDVAAAPVEKRDDPSETPWSRVISLSIGYAITDAPDDRGNNEFTRTFSTTINLRNNTF